jgi:integrase
VSVYQRGGLWHYDFSHKRERFRGPCGTGVKTKTAARQVEAKKRGEAQAGEIGARKAPTLCDFAPHFLKLIGESQHLRPATKRGYAYGLQLLAKTAIWRKRLDQIHSETAEAATFPGASSGNTALRTLRHLLHIARKRKLLRDVPEFKMFRERRRMLVIEPWLEDLMLEKSSAKLRAVITLMLDSGMRPFEVAAMRWEDVQWTKNRIFIPVSKSEAGIRHVGMSTRMAFELRLLAPPPESPEPWVFSSDGGRSGRKALSGHLSARSVGKMWARMKAQVVAAIAQRYPAEQWPADLVLYSCRHTGATRYSDAVGNEFKVASLLGHSDTRITRGYVHHDVDSGKVMDEYRETKLLQMKRRA